MRLNSLASHPYSDYCRDDFLTIFKDTPMTKYMYKPERQLGRMLEVTPFSMQAVIKFLTNANYKIMVRLWKPVYLNPSLLIHSSLKTCGKQSLML